MKKPMNLFFSSKKLIIEKEQNEEHKKQETKISDVDAPSNLKKNDEKLISSCPKPLQIFRSLNNQKETIIDNSTNNTLFKVYVLECENETFYVGVTKNMEERYKAHLEGNGAVWTNINKPLKYYIHKEFETRREANVEENALTLSLMYKHSISKVRGGRFSNPVLNKFLMLSLKTEMAHNESLCFQCFKPGHYIRECPNTKNVIVKKF